MFRHLWRASVVGAWLGVLVGGSFAHARPYEIKDLLNTEGIGHVLVSPAGRWLVFERLGAFADMPRQDMLMQNEVLRSTPYVVDLAKPGPARRLLPASLKAGTILYAFSPDGNRLAVGRLAGQKWQLGVVDLSSGATRWWKLSPDYTPFAKTLEWVSATRLVLLAQRHGEWPWWLRDGYADGSATRQRWNDTRAGGPAAVTVAGSGRFHKLTPGPVQKNLLAIDVTTGRTEVLATGPIKDIRLSPDRRYIAEMVLGDMAPAPTREPLSPLSSQWQRRLVLFRLADRHVSIPCPTCDLASMPQWSPGSGQLAMIARRDGGTWAESSLLRVDVGRGEANAISLPDLTPIISGPPILPPSFKIAWDGEDLLIYARKAGEPAAKPAWFGLRAGEAYPLTSATAGTAPALIATRDCRKTLFGSNDIWCADGAVSRLVASDLRPILPDIERPLGHIVGIDRTRRLAWPESAAHPIVDLLEGDRVDPATVSLPDGIALVRHRSQIGVTDLVLADRNRRIALTSINTHLAQVQAATSVALHHRLPDGAEVTSWLLLPATASRSEKLPLVVVPYAGYVYGDQPPTSQQIDGSTFYANGQLLAAHGYAVLAPSMPDLPVSDGEPLALADQVGSAVDAAVATGRIDAQRLAIWGQSFGGYSAALIASQTDRYKAVVASAAPFDLPALVGVMTPASRATPEAGLTSLALLGWFEAGQARFGVMPWDNPKRYITNSPFFRAGRITTPMLFITADWDIIPPTQAEQMFAALYRQNKDAVILSYWNESHVIGSRSNLTDLYQRIFAWLPECLNRSADRQSGNGPR